MIFSTHGSACPLRLQWHTVQRRVLCWRSHMSQNGPVTASYSSNFTVQHTDGSARAGLLSGRPTPAPILYTFRGLPFSMTPDLLEDLWPAAQALHLDASQL